MDLEFIFIFIFSTRGEINEAINWPLSRFERKKRKIGAFKNRFCTTTAKAVCDLVAWYWYLDHGKLIINYY